MANFDLTRELALATASKIVLLVADGLGGLPRPGGNAARGPTELEMASKLNLDRLAAEGQCGLIDPVAPGITPGSGPAHLALFGYDPIAYQIGRGVLEALGIDFDLQPNDVATRGNFCTVDQAGRITDRRAGRISTEEAAKRVELLSRIRVEGAEVFVRPVREYRFVAVFRGAGLAGELADSDPQQLGVPPLPIEPLTPQARPTAAIVNRFVTEASKVLAGQEPANMVLLRGFSKRPALPQMAEVYRLKPAAIAVYPMYRGLAKLVGMKLLPAGQTLEDQIAALERHWADHDFFYLHLKKTDAAGEDGAFDRKVAAIEELDRHLPRLLALRPDVLIVTGDHSTPSALRSHSWHPVPLLLWSRWCRPSRVKGFYEAACAGTELGRFPSADLLPLALAHALKLTKYGA